MDSIVEYFDEVIEINEDAMNSWRRWWKILIVIGIIMFVAGVLIYALKMFGATSIDNSLVPALPASFGILSGSASFYPLKEITPRRLAVAKYTQLRKKCISIKELPEDQQQEQLERLNKLLSI